MNGELIVVDDVPSAFADFTLRAFHSRLEDRFSIALSGGSTARRCYEKLAQFPDEMDWWSVDIYWGDERCVPPDSPDSNERLVREALLERVGAADAVYPMRCDEGTDPYQLRVGELGKFDLIHLGLGADGHTASLFPNSPALEAFPGQLVAFNEDPSGRNPLRRMTLTLSGIARGRQVVFTVEGEEKQAAMQAISEGQDFPASRVTADNIVWLVDRGAAPR